jgi:two-component system chemotaxis response regulator CheB
MYKALVIGGSAGSLMVASRILQALPVNFGLPVFLALHRQKQMRTGLLEVLAAKSSIPIVEPFDKELIKPGRAYLAPSNYHMFIDLGNRFALSTDEPVFHSRPSIDLTFTSAAQVYRDKLIGVMLSGANRDGANGMKKVADFGGFTIVQHPDDAEVSTMPNAAIETSRVDKLAYSSEIINFLRKLK